ncbi:alpha/beta-hydrolase [Phaeosphaeriaceae sp. SRC1lsM3a]|nr:alpha/beta-hydrolase [Stagonospora sp. SRC1lsM3a]
MSPDLAILLAHGSFHKASSMNSFLGALCAQGYKASCPQLPTADPARLVADPSNPSFNQPPPPNGVPEHIEDAKVLIAALKELIEDEGKEVLLVAHSSGGWSATEAATHSLRKSSRKDAGKSGGLIGILYIAAFLIKPGESVYSIFSSMPSVLEEESWVNRPPSASSSHLATVNNPAHFFFHDLPAHKALELAKDLTASPHLASVLSNCAYGTLPMGYLVCETDRLLPLRLQEAMIRGAEEVGKFEMKVYRCGVGHECFYSDEEGVVKVVGDFARRCG